MVHGLTEYRLDSVDSVAWIPAAYFVPEDLCANSLMTLGHESVFDTPRIVKIGAGSITQDFLSVRLTAPEDAHALDNSADIP